MNLTTLTNKVNQLTAQLQQLINLGKKIGQLPEKQLLDEKSKLVVDTNGVTETLTVGQIITEAINSSFDGIIELGAMTLVGNTLTIASPSKAKIDGIVYVSGENVINIPFSASGFIRQDILVFNKNSNIIRIAGTETDGIAIAPNVPNNTVLVSSIYVTESTIGNPSDPIIGTNYVNIPSQGIYQYSANNPDTIVGTFEIPTVKHIEIIANVLEVQDIINEVGMYVGFDIKIINKQTTDVTFTQSTNTKLINGTSIILKPNETIHFVYEGNETFRQSGAITSSGGGSVEAFQKNEFYTTSLADLGVTTFDEVTFQIISDWRNSLAIVEEDNVNYYFEVLEEATFLNRFEFTSGNAPTQLEMEVAIGESLINPLLVNDVWTFGNSKYTIIENSFLESEIKSVLSTAENIGSYAFGLCNSLTDVNFPIAKTFDEACFAISSSLVNINIPLATDFGTQCFDSCDNVVEFNLPLGKNFGDLCFLGCINALIFNLPSAINIGNECFSSCFRAANFNLNSVIILGNSINDEFVFKDITGKNISISVPIALQTINGGNMDGDLQYLADNNTVTFNWV